MFAKSSYTILPKKYIYTKVTSIPTSGNHFMITQDGEEITVVTAEENADKLDLLEKNSFLWRLVSLNLAVPFTAGVLAVVNTACAKENLNNLIVSTYSKDYIVVKDEQLEKIITVLNSLGFSEKSPPTE